MKEHLNRREFMAFLAAAGTAAVTPHAQARPPSPSLAVPRRAFGNSGAKISKLCLGGASLAGPNSQALLDEAFRSGVDFWEITSIFGGKIHGEYFAKHPEARAQVFLSAKTDSTDPTIMQRQLDQTLGELGTSGIDFFAVHTVDDIKVLTREVRHWVEAAKKRQTIRFFGFCTHRDMDKTIRAAADLGWIDGIQTFYNYRLQSLPSMEDALGKCHEKGIGLIAIKSMGLGVQPETDLRKLAPNAAHLDGLLSDRHLSFAQAKLKAIWQNDAVTSICSLMPNSEILQSNVMAAMDEAPLDQELTEAMANYAENTGRYFCRRCGGICETANADKIPISTIMIMLLYSRGCGQPAFAAKFFAGMPAELRERMRSSDYSKAEERCPQKMPIGQLMHEYYAECSG